MDVIDTTTAKSPLHGLDEWADDVLKRYPDPESIIQNTNNHNSDTAREAGAYRDYTEQIDQNTQKEVDPTKERVKTFYRINHTFQTYDFATSTRAEFLKFNRKELTVWEAFDFLNQLVDDSDPDTDLDQFQHLLQTAEAIRKDGHPDWMVLTGLMHDLGKVLCLFGQPQWAVVGDTFPVGCAFSKKIVYSEYFDQFNPDAKDERYNTKLGVYTEGCGLRNVTMSWGHDEYLYHILKGYLPEEGLYMLRYHSFYAWHREGEYGYLMDDHDRAMLPWVKLFNPYDLYSKCPVKPDWEALKPYYVALIEKYLPKTLKF